MGGLAAGSSSVWVATALTGAAFVVLHHFGWLGDVPLPVVLVLLVVAAIPSAAPHSLWGREPTPRRVNAFVLMRVLGVTAIIYAIGWGPLLAVGYVFVMADAVEEYGSAAWKPSLVGIMAGIACGQIAVTVGLVHMYIGQPQIHVLALLSVLGTAFVVHLFGTKAAEQEGMTAQLRELFADNPQPMWVVDAQTMVFLEVNDAVVGTAGRSSSLAGSPISVRPTTCPDCWPVSRTGRVESSTSSHGTCSKTAA
jgi:hypothetical protein